MSLGLKEDLVLRQWKPSDPDTWSGFYMVSKSWPTPNSTSFHPDANLTSVEVPGVDEKNEYMNTWKDERMVISKPEFNWNGFFSSGNNGMKGLFKSSELYASTTSLPSHLTNLLAIQLSTYRSIYKAQVSDYNILYQRGERLFSTCYFRTGGGGGGGGLAISVLLAHPAWAVW